MTAYPYYECVSVCVTLYCRRMEIIGIIVERTIGENGERDNSV